jgi:hypothetical protein
MKTGQTPAFDHNPPRFFACHSEPCGSLRAGSAKRNFLVILNEAERSVENALII